MNKSPYIPPDTDLDLEEDFQRKNSRLGSDKRLYAILATITVCTITWFSWAIISDNRTHDECSFYALGAVHEYMFNGTYDEDALKAESNINYEILPKAHEHIKESMEKLHKQSIVYESKSKAAYDYCLRFNE